MNSLRAPLDHFITDIIQRQLVYPYPFFYGFASYGTAAIFRLNLALHAYNEIGDIDISRFAPLSLTSIPSGLDVDDF
jgi:hypothetical protein